MRHLDEATTAAVAGEVEDVRFVELICCHLIDACKRVRDFDRAREWCRRVEEIATRLGDVQIFTLCRNYYGELLVWRGAWNEAEQALAAASRDLAKAGRDASDSLVRLAELRRRQRRFEEAEALLAEAEGHPLASIVAAALALDRGDTRRGAEEAERYLRRVGEDDRLMRVPALELLVPCTTDARSDARGATGRRGAGSNRGVRRHSAAARRRPACPGSSPSPRPIRGRCGHARGCRGPVPRERRARRGPRRPSRGGGSAPCASVGKKKRVKRRPARAPSWPVSEWPCRSARRRDGDPTR